MRARTAAIAAASLMLAPAAAQAASSPIRQDLRLAYDYWTITRPALEPACPVRITVGELPNGEWANTLVGQCAITISTAMWQAAHASNQTGRYNACIATVIEYGAVLGLRSDTPRLPIMSSTWAVASTDTDVFCTREAYGWNALTRPQQHWLQSHVVAD
jgi:hypothetical protein